MPCWPDHGSHLTSPVSFPPPPETLARQASSPHNCPVHLPRSKTQLSTWRYWFIFPFFAAFLDELLWVLSRIQNSRQSCIDECSKSTVPVSGFWFLSLDPLINLPFRKSKQNRLGRFRACRNFRFHPSTFETEFRDFKIHLINYTNFHLSKISEFWSKIAARAINYPLRTYTSAI